MMMDQFDDLFPPPPPPGADLTGMGHDGEGDSDSSLDVDQELSNKEGRIIRRGKRGVKLDGTGVAGVNGLSTSVPVTCYMSAAAKNSRKSRNTFTHSRGEPKKGGAGGKGVWGKLGSELEESSLCVDKGDPNYDSDNQGDYTLEEVSIILTKDQLLKAVEPMIREYLEHGKTVEVEELLSGLNIGPNSKEVAKLAVTIALEKHNPQREMISRLISDLYGKILTSEEIAKAFDELLENVDDLVLDTPEAPVLIGQFIARCIADDCLPPKFITGYKGKVKNDRVKEALEKADVLLSMNHGLAHLDNIWGVGGGNHPVRSLSNKIIDLVKEYLNSGDKEEARRCLVELEVPHFHHELVYQSGEIVIEETTERARDQVVDLLKYFTESNVVTMDQFEKGIRRLFKDIGDIFLDVPAAYVMLDLLMDKLKQEGVASQALIAEMPKSSRGGRCRKRFVSEGDGGRLKAEYDEDGELITAA